MHSGENIHGNRGPRKSTRNKLTNKGGRGKKKFHQETTTLSRPDSSMSNTNNKNGPSDPFSVLSRTARTAQFITGGPLGGIFSSSSSKTPPKLTMTEFRHLAKERLTLERAQKKWKEEEKKAKKTKAKREQLPAPRGRALIWWYLKHGEAEKEAKREEKERDGDSGEGAPEGRAVTADRGGSESRSVPETAGHAPGGGKPSEQQSMGDAEDDEQADAAQSNEQDQDVDAPNGATEQSTIGSTASGT